MTLVSVTAYHSFAGEVEASNTPHDTPPYPFMPSPTSAHSSDDVGTDQPLALVWKATNQTELAQGEAAGPEPCDAADLIGRCLGTIERRLRPRRGFLSLYGDDIGHGAVTIRLWPWW